MKTLRAKAKDQKAQRTALLPRGLARRLRGMGLDPARHILLPSITQADYRDLERRLNAKTQRVEWQSGGIQMLHGEIARLKALLATQPAMQDAALERRVEAVAAKVLIHEAEHVVADALPRLT